jgi:exosome complex exonuclease RRP6
VQQLLRTARSSLTRPAAAATRSLIATASHNNSSKAAGNDDEEDDDPDGSLFTDLTAVLDDTLERLDAALDASQAATEQFKLGGWAAPAGSRQHFRTSAAGGALAGSAARFSKVQRHIANLPRPQDAFPDAIVNSNSPWSPSCHAHLDPRLAAAAAAAAPADPLALHAAQLAAAAAGGSSAGAAAALHPYAAELDSLRYQPWQLQAPAQPLSPAADFDAVPFTLVDSPEALAAMVQQLQGQQQIAIDLEHHSYRCVCM